MPATLIDNRATMPCGPERRWLVTTPSSKVDNRSKERLLAPWCVRDPDELIEALATSGNEKDIVEYHWDDRAKFAMDYEYLEQLHGRLLGALSTALNELHGVKHSMRYWRILLDPWLAVHVGVQFDRWEQLRKALADGEAFAAMDAPLISAPFSYSQYLEWTMSDDWNAALMARMLRFQFAGQVAMRTAPNLLSAERTKPRAATPGLIQRGLSFLDRCLEPLSRRNPVALIDTYFGLPALVRLSLKLRCVPRLYRREFADVKIDVNVPAIDRSCWRIPFEAASSFERYLAASLSGDVPAAAVEHYASLVKGARALRFQPDVIVTAGAHWTNIAAKVWMAECVAKGSCLLIHNHGGSLPAKREFFGFEDAIADRRGTWFRAHHAKHVQLPPSKLVSLRHRGCMPLDDSARLCLVVGNEYPRWTIRAHFAPMAHQCLRSYKQVLQLAQLLRGEVRASLRIRPAPDLGWGLRDCFRRHLGEESIMVGGALLDAFSQARLIICTYPETTFCEAIATGRPTILLYTEEVFERHPVAANLLAQLRAARMVFVDHESAAAHVSRVWENPRLWWESAATVAARSAFIGAAMTINGDWIVSWVREIQRLSETSNARASL